MKAFTPKIALTLLLIVGLSSLLLASGEIEIRRPTKENPRFSPVEGQYIFIWKNDTTPEQMGALSTRLQARFPKARLRRRFNGTDIQGASTGSTPKLRQRPVDTYEMDKDDVEGFANGTIPIVGLDLAVL